jgi:hypothetical protein
MIYLPALYWPNMCVFIMKVPREEFSWIVAEKADLCRRFP